MKIIINRNENLSKIEVQKGKKGLENTPKTLQKHIKIT